MYICIHIYIYILAWTCAYPCTEYCGQVYVMTLQLCCQSVGLSGDLSSDLSCALSSVLSWQVRSYDTSGDRKYVPTFSVHVHVLGIILEDFQNHHLRPLCNGFGHAFNKTRIKITMCDACAADFHARRDVDGSWVRLSSGMDANRLHCFTGWDSNGGTVL